MTDETRRRLPPRIDDELSATAPRRDMPAGGAVTGLAALPVVPARLRRSEPGVRAGGEAPRDGGVALSADVVPHVGGPFDSQGWLDDQSGGGTRDRDSRQRQGRQQQGTPFHAHAPIRVGATVPREIRFRPRGCHFQ